MNKELLEKYYTNACTETELSSVLEWFEKSSGTQENKAFLFTLWEELQDEATGPEINFDFILDKIHHKVNLDQSRKLLEKAKQDLIKFKRRKHFINVLTRVAAILMLPVFTFGLYMSFKYKSNSNSHTSVHKAFNEVFSSVDAITKVTLPDGSIAWLNHSSALKYPAVFNGAVREVELTGEGYFEVAHNTKIPFIVSVGAIQIKATGTAFNIMAYPDDDRIETSLINGRIEIQQKEPDGSVIPILEMKPTELAIFQKSNNEFSTRTVSDDRYFSWKEGKLIFNKESMNEVVKKLSRWFNVVIQIKDPELYDLTYTATISNETLPQVMELIAMVSPVNYTISKRQEISPGIFTRRKIILSYKYK